MCVIGGYDVGDLVGHLPPELSDQIAILLKKGAKEGITEDTIVSSVIVHKHI
jgi:hypothetical protein